MPGIAARDNATLFPPTAADRLRVAGVGLVIAGVCSSTILFRFLAITGFSNDHFVHLGAAHQMLFGIGRWLLWIRTRGGRAFSDVFPLTRSTWALTSHTG